MGSQLALQRMGDAYQLTLTLMKYTSRFRRAAVSYGLIAALALGSSLAALPIESARAAAGQLSISEINWGGSQGNAADEWVEIYNPASGGLVDFATNNHTLTLLAADGTPLSSVTIDSGSLAAGERLLIHELPDVSSTVNHVGLITFQASLNLPDAPSQYILTDQDGLELDALRAPAPGQAIPFTGAAPTSSTPGSSMARVYVAGEAADGTLSSSWTTSMTIGATFDSAVIQYGTPGAENIELAAPADVAIDPADFQVFPDMPMITGSTVPEADSVTLFVHRMGPVESQTEVPAIIDGSNNFSVEPSLLAGRYHLSVGAEDADGNRSARVPVSAHEGDVTGIYEIIADSSVVPAPVISNHDTFTSAGSILIEGTVEPGVEEVDVLVGPYVDETEYAQRYQQTVPVIDGVFSATVTLFENELNVLWFVAHDVLGQVSVPTEDYVVHDNIAPDMVDADKVVLSANRPGAEDAVAGLPGAAEPFAQVLLFADAALTEAISAPILVMADGSFPSVSLGDNKYATVWVAVRDAAGNVSPALALANPISFEVPGGLQPRVVEVGENSAQLAWNDSAGAVNYLVKYRLSDGTFADILPVCAQDSLECMPQTNLHGLRSGSAYVFAVAAVDAAGNVSAYSEIMFVTAQPPALEIPATAGRGSGFTRVQPSPSATPEPSVEEEQGDVMSTAEEAGRNWTPWIVLAILVGIAILASLGYFYWFGGVAGEQALASAEAAREQTAAQEATKTTNTNGKKAPPKGKRW